MKQVLAFGTFILTGAFIASACSASDSKHNPDTTQSAGGNGGSGGSGGSTSSITGDSTSTGGTTTSTSSGGTQGTTTTSGSGGAAGDSAGGAAGAAGDTWQSTTGEATTGEGGSAGMPIDCHGDEAVLDLPSCDDLSYNQVVCNGNDPAEPFGLSLCKEWEANGTNEAFEALFDCLNQIDVADDCDTDHDDAVRTCRDDVAGFSCPNEDAAARCSNLGCTDIDISAGGECDIYLSSLTPEGIQHVVDCTNDGTMDQPGGTWGTPPNPNAGTPCDEVFLTCVSGTRQPNN